MENKFKRIINSHISRTGIIYKNKIYETEHYRHYDKILEIATGKLKEQVDESLKLLEHVENECQKLIEIGEHPEWHNYEICLSQEITNTISNFYDNGGVRFYFNSKNNTVHFEGKSGISNIFNLINYCRNNDYNVKINK